MRDCEVKLTSERREEAPRLFTHINLHFIVTGQDLTDKIVERAVNLSAEKYCSVALMLNKAATVTHSFRDPPTGVSRRSAARRRAQRIYSIFLPSSNRCTSGAMISSIASPILPPGTTNVLMCEINEPCSIASK